MNKKSPFYHFACHCYDILKSIHHHVVFAFKYPFFFLPINKKKIVFLNFNGKGYGDNPKYIAQEMLSQSLNLKYYWCVSDRKEEMPEKIKKIKIYSLKYIYHLSTAKVIITNVKCYIDCVKKKSQYVILTNHGSFSPKLIEGECLDKLPKDYIKETMKNSKDTDLFLSNSRLASQEFRDYFWCKCEILEKGFPRNDAFFDLQDEHLNRIKKELHVPLGYKVLFYCPTFRDNGNTDCYDLDLKKALEILKKKTGEKWICLVRFHPNLRRVNPKYIHFDEDILNVTDYPDGSEILTISDFLISDYSSTAFDYMLLKRPFLFYASDIEEYQKMRGLKPIFFEMSFVLAKNNAEFEEMLTQFDFSAFQKTLEDFCRNVYMPTDDGKASYHVVEKIKKEMGLLSDRK